MPLVSDILANPEKYDETLVEVARWLESDDGKAAEEEAWREVGGFPPRMREDAQ